MRHILRALLCIIAATVLSTCYAAVTFSPETATPLALSTVEAQGPNFYYHILEARELSPDSLEAWLVELEECSGANRPTDAPLLVVNARIIVVQLPMLGLDMIDTAAGVWLAPEANTTGKHVVAVVRDFPGDADALLKHELLHYVTQLSHPEIDPMLTQCVGDVYPEMEEQ